MRKQAENALPSKRENGSLQPEQSNTDSCQPLEKADYQP
jgi:hypothetical protein